MDGIQAFPFHTTHKGQGHHGPLLSHVCHNVEIEPQLQPLSGQSILGLKDCKQKRRGPAGHQSPRFLGEQ